MTQLDCFLNAVANKVHDVSGGHLDDQTWVEVFEDRHGSDEWHNESLLFIFDSDGKLIEVM